MRDREPVRIVAIAVPMICEAIAVMLFLSACAVGLILAHHGLPV